MGKIRNIFACLVHENQECILDLVRNLRALDPASQVLLYNGGSNPDLLSALPSLARQGATLHPSPRPLAWGRLHDFALDCLEFALHDLPFDTLTVVDSDQLSTRPGYSEYLSVFMNGRTGLGMLVNTPGVQPPQTRVGPAVAAYQEFELWRPFLRRFPDGERKFAHWSFWPTSIFTADAAHDLVNLFRHDRQLSQIMERTRIWASEEIILPTLAALLGYEIGSNPCSYEYVRYRTPYSLAEADAALSRRDVFWMHPVPRRYQDPLRVHLRSRLNQYLQATPKKSPMPTDIVSKPGLLLTRPILARMRTIEGWLADEEADLLIAAAARAVSGPPAPAVIVEIGSYCGRSTVVLGSVLQSLGLVEARVYAIDPHDGRVGALDQGIQQVAPSLDKFQRNIAAAGLNGLVETIRSHSFEVPWEKPISFLFIDGLHDYMNVARDFYHFEKWVAVGGYVAFHDYADYYPGVQMFVNEIMAAGTCERVHREGSLIILRKRGEAILPEAPAVQPLVSCLMPTANRRAFVPLAIRYFLRQDYPNRELIILDDGEDSVADLIPADHRIRYLRMEERRTMGSKHNQGCRLARGDIIAHWDDDDWFTESRLSYQVSELLKQPQMTLTGLSRLLFYSPSADRAWEYAYPPAQLPWVCGSTFCYRKAFWEHHPFPDMNEGADTVFVWGLNGDARVLALSDHRCLVGIIHPHNTSPKRTDGAGWRPLPTEQIHDLLGTDISFYRDGPHALARWR